MNHQIGAFGQTCRRHNAGGCIRPILPTVCKSRFCMYNCTLRVLKQHLLRCVLFCVTLCLLRFHQTTLGLHPLPQSERTNVRSRAALASSCQGDLQLMEEVAQLATTESRDVFDKVDSCLARWPHEYTTTRVEFLIASKDRPQMPSQT